MSRNHLLLSLPDAESRQQVLQLLQRQAPQCDVIEDIQDCHYRPLCRWLQSLPAQSLGEVQGTLDDAIDVLERSRHAFKSTQLATLRKRLSRLVEELSAPDNCGTT